MKMLINRFSTIGRRFPSKIPQFNNRLVVANVSQTSTTTKGKDLMEDTDAPVKYTASAASHWKARTSRVGYENVRLWYEPYVIIVSLAVFMVYFGILREENDVDEELKKSLYSRIEGLEEHQLRVSLNYNREHNLETSQILERLAEIEREKAQPK